jgi:hypothetical protein
VAHALRLIALAGALLLVSCGGAASVVNRGPSPRERFAEALLNTRHAGSAAVLERAVSSPPAYELEVSGRMRFDYDDARLTVAHILHPQLAPNTVFHVLIANSPYVRRTTGGWYVPPYHTGEFELGHADFLHLVSRGYGRVEAEGARTLLVSMSRENLDRLRTSAEGSLGPLGTLYDLIEPMRFELDANGRIVRWSYTVTGRYFFSLTPMHRVHVEIAYRDFDQDFEVEPPPGDQIKPGPLIPPQRGTRADSSRL